MSHEVYGAIVDAIRAGALIEPFSKENFRAACPGFGNGTYNAFLDKHRCGNPAGNFAAPLSIAWMTFAANSNAKSASPFPT